MARQNGLDLVEVSPNAQPPVVRMMDYGAYRYRLEKQASKQRKHQKKIEIKGVRIGMKIGEHDFAHKVKRTQEFLKEGHKIKLELVMRGREQAPQLRNRALDRIDAFLRALGPGVIREQEITKTGNRLTLMLGLSKSALAQQNQPKQQTNAKTQDTQS